MQFIYKKKKKKKKKSFNFLFGWFVLQHINPCWVILCQNQFNDYGLQLYTVQNNHLNRETHFTISNKSIWSIDKRLTSTTTPGQSGPGGNNNEEYSKLSRVPKLVLHHQTQFSVITRTLVKLIKLSSTEYLFWFPQN